MIAAAVSAVRDVLSPPFRAVLWKSLALTVTLFAALLLGSQFALSYLEFARFAWLEPLIAVAAGAGLFVAFIVFAAPVTALFAGLFLDHVASIVERTHYPADAAGRPLPFAQSILTGVRFALVMLIVNALALPFLFLGVGAVAMLLANAYLLSREYFELAGHRHLSPAHTAELRRAHGGWLFAAGLLPAALMLVPFANLLVPLFSTAYYTHIFKSISRG
jgi:CysZ protein